MAGFVLTLWGALSSFIPIVNLAGDLLAFVGLILAIIGLVNSGSKGAGRGLSMAAITLAVFAFAISIMVNIAAAAVVSAIPTTPRALGSPHATSQAKRPAPATSCSVVSEALRTGTPAQIHTGMLALIADKSANQSARGYANYYTERDKEHQDLQRLHASLIQSACA